MADSNPFLDLTAQVSTNINVRPHPSDGAHALLDGDVPETAAEMLQRGMALYPGDPPQADFLLAFAVTQAPLDLSVYRTLYKFYNRQRRFDLAWDYATRSLEEAARQCHLPRDWRQWTNAALRAADPNPASHTLLALKALAFIGLRRGDEGAAQAMLRELTRLDPEDGTGASVVAALADGMGTDD